MNLNRQYRVNIFGYITGTGSESPPSDNTNNSHQGAANEDEGEEEDWNKQIESVEPVRSK